MEEAAPSPVAQAESPAVHEAYEHVVVVDDAHASASAAHNPREQWGSRISFVLSSAGAAIGFGNFFRFPYLLYDSGGGVFLIPYIVCMLFLGIPLLLLEYSLGQLYRAGPIVAFQRVNKRTGGVGLAAVLFGSYLICTYYVVILAWVIVYFVLTFNPVLPWEEDPVGFFDSVILNKSSDALSITGFSWPVFFALAFCWVVIYISIFRGTKSVGAITFITVPLPYILLVLMFIRALFLPGAGDGALFYITPDITRLWDPTIWLRAVGQVFFSLSVSSGIQIAYASHKPENENPLVDAFVVGLSDAFFSIFCGFVMFMLLGNIAHIRGGIPINQVAESGLQLGFVTLASSTHILPFPHVFSIWLFLTMFTLGIDSAFSLVEALNSIIKDRWPKTSLAVISAFTCGIGFVLGIFFCLSNGSFVMDIIDHYASDFCMVLIGVAECLVIGWMVAKKSLKQVVAERLAYPSSAHRTLMLIKDVLLHSVDDFRYQIQTLNKFHLPWIEFSIIVKWIAPIVLLILLVMQVFAEVQRWLNAPKFDWLEAGIGVTTVGTCIACLFSGVVFTGRTGELVATAPSAVKSDTADGIILADISTPSNNKSDDVEAIGDAGTPQRFEQQEVSEAVELV